MRGEWVNRGWVAALCAAASMGMGAVPAAAHGGSTVAHSGAALAAPALGTGQSPLSLIDTRNGSLGGGFPMVAAGLPFGMAEPGADTSMPDGSQDPVDYCGYSYQDPAIRGFSLTHFDGAGIHIAGSLPFMPTTGAISTSDPAHNASPYDHATEVAQPGYYSVQLERYATQVELTATTRAAMMRFTFPAGQQANVLAEVSRAIDSTGRLGTVSVVGRNELRGWVNDDVDARMYFDAVFDHPFTASTATPGASKSARATATLDTSTSPVVTMRVGMSWVSADGAAANLASEIPAGRSFDDVRSAAQRAWSTELAKAAVSGGSLGHRQTYYDNLYRSLLMPTVFEDGDGRYLGMDGQIHTVTPGHHHFSSLSLWDTYRSQAPLLGLIEPAVTHDVLVSLLDDADQNHGVIPRWVQSATDRGIMAGDSGSAQLADGAVSGLLSPADTRRALDLLVTQATSLPGVWPREHLQDLVHYGYIPADLDGHGTSTTLEYGIDDSDVAHLAAALGDRADAAALQRRSGDWRNLLDPSTMFIRPRNRDGSWADPTHVGDPTGTLPIDTGQTVPYNPALQDGYDEGTGWQWFWAVPQDVAGLAASIGGPAPTLKRLDEYFSTALNTPAAPAVAVAQAQASFFGVYYIGNQYTPANETDLWAPWYYDYLGQPWKAQKVARAEMAAYNQTPYGMPGNDDTGEMSAWYVEAALGLYHVTPGVDAWELSSPAFPQAQLQVGDRTLHISAPGASASRFYVHGMTLRNRPVTRTYLTTCQLLRGGSLRVALGALPDKSWGTGSDAAPPSDSAPSADADACARHLVSAG